MAMEYSGGWTPRHSYREAPGDSVWSYRRHSAILFVLQLQPSHTISFRRKRSCSSNRIRERCPLLSQSAGLYRVLRQQRCGSSSSVKPIIVLCYASTMLCPLQASFFLHIQYRFAISCQKPENAATAFLIIRKKNVIFIPKAASARDFPALCTARDQCPLVALRPMMPTRSRHTKMARRGNIASLKSSMPTTTDPSAPMPVQIA